MIRKIISCGLTKCSARLAVAPRVNHKWWALSYTTPDSVKILGIKIPYERTRWIRVLDLDNVKEYRKYRKHTNSAKKYSDREIVDFLRKNGDKIRFLKSVGGGSYYDDEWGIEEDYDAEYIPVYK